ncbi:MAG: HU family DNA-binding protein [Paracoccaceae bacterium]
MVTTTKKAPAKAAPAATSDIRKSAKTPKSKSGSVASTAPDTKSGTGDAGPNLVRRKELVERIVAASGLKPNAVKTILDAVLKEMGDILSSGEGLNVQPLGKLVVNRRKDIPGGQILNCKLRRKSATPESSAAIEKVSAPG